jgi:hypothetical protein
MLERATGQLCYDFPENANYLVFEDQGQAQWQEHCYC